MNTAASEWSARVAARNEIPGWLLCAICALPFVLIAIDILDR